MDSAPMPKGLPSSSSSPLLGAAALSNDDAHPHQCSKSLSRSPPLQTNVKQLSPIIDPPLVPDESWSPTWLPQPGTTRRSTYPLVSRKNLTENKTAEVSKAPPVKENSESSLSDVTFGSVQLLSPWFPQIVENEEVAITWRTRLKRRRVVLWSCFTLGSMICITNLVLTLVSWIHVGVSNDQISTIFEGDCRTATRLDTGLHVLINIMSTLLLSASNLALQLVVSPTRHDVDVAHKKGVWLDIGVPSFRNLWHISRSSVIVVRINRSLSSLTPTSLTFLFHPI
jgi:hypothetical protein